MPSLADIYSTIDSFKRRLGDTVANPIQSFQQGLGNANDQARVLNQQLAESAQEFPKYGPKTQELAGKLAEGYNPTGMTVYHGSPYKFKAFDASKIGKGEGAQAYGHGLYVAENPNVAKQYAKNVKDLDSIQSYNQRLKQLSKTMDEDSVYPGAYRTFNSEKGKQAAQEYDAVMEMRDQKSTDPGNLYKIDLPDEHIEKMLDWDMPLSKQPKNVQSWLKDTYNPYKTQLSANDIGGNEPTGSLIYNRLQELMSEGKKSDVFTNQGNFGAKNVSKELSDYGIPGIKYLDQDSREIQEGTRNFVIFPGHEGLLNIQDINGNLIK
jgi:hypothetical protein